MCNLHVNSVVHLALYPLLVGPNLWPAVLSNNICLFHAESSSALTEQKIMKKINNTSATIRRDSICQKYLKII